jgi:hypothetical protein
MPEGQGQDWMDLYRDALLELDLKELPGRIQKAQNAIRERFQKLPQDPKQYNAERQALEDALQNLRVLTRELKSEA